MYLERKAIVHIVRMEVDYAAAAGERVDVPSVLLMFREESAPSFAFVSGVVDRDFRGRMEFRGGVVLLVLSCDRLKHG